MICQECKAAGLKSRVTPHGGASTLMYCEPFYDEEGKYHHHDLNVLTSSFSCSNGHQWVTKSHPKCPGCDWPNDEPGSGKVEEKHV